MDGRTDAQVRIGEGHLSVGVLHGVNVCHRLLHHIVDLYRLLVVLLPYTRPYFRGRFVVLEVEELGVVEGFVVVKPIIYNHAKRSNALRQLPQEGRVGVWRNLRCPDISQLEKRIVESTVIDTLHAVDLDGVRVPLIFCSFPRNVLVKHVRLHHRFLYLDAQQHVRLFLNEASVHEKFAVACD
jgi:hypothetical protein